MDAAAGVRKAKGLLTWNEARAPRCPQKEHRLKAPVVPKAAFQGLSAPPRRTCQA